MLNTKSVVNRMMRTADGVVKANGYRLLQAKLDNDGNLILLDEAGKEVTPDQIPPIVINTDDLVEDENGDFHAKVNYEIIETNETKSKKKKKVAKNK